MENLEIGGRAGDCRETGGKRLPARPGIQVGRERLDRPALEVEIAVRVAAGSKEEHGAAPCAAKLVVRDGHVCARQEGDRDTRLPAVAERRFYLFENAVISRGQEVQGRSLPAPPP